VRRCQHADLGPRLPPSAASPALLLAPITFVHANMGFVGLKAFPAARGRRLRQHSRRAGRRPDRRASSSRSAGFYLPEGFKDIAAYVVVLVMLVVKPNGLFGENLTKKV
jgi:branched-chain amino acid transport system permease protein